MPSDKENVFSEFMNKGHSAAWEGDWEEAAKNYGRAQKENPDNATALISVAQAQFELGNHEKALSNYERASQVSPDDPLPLEKAAQIFALNEQVDQAVDYSKRAAELHVKARDAESAIKSWALMISLKPENLSAHERLASTYESLGQTKQAITEYIAVASLLQNAGKLEEAQEVGKHALKLDPKNEEAQNANEQLSSFQSLPVPSRKGGAPGLIPVQKPQPKRASINPSNPEAEGLNPQEEASQTALTTLANMLFELSSTEEEKQPGGIRSIAKVVADGIMSRGFNEKKIVQHLNKAIELHSQNEIKLTAQELELAVKAGLDHPAAHFELGVLRSQIERHESAQRSFQRAVKHADFAMAARLLIAKYLYDQKRIPEAAAEYLQALKLADSAVLKEEQATALAGEYELLIESHSVNENLKELDQLCSNIQLLLFRPNWRKAVEEARSQLPSTRKGTKPLPLADVLTQANSGNLVDALSRVNKLAREGNYRSALEETYLAMETAPNYLPLHVNMAELMLVGEKTSTAIEKFATVARVYSSRGEAERATQMYERIVDVSPMNTEVRELLIDQITAQGNFEEAIAEYIKMADVYYRLAQLEMAKRTYETALNLAQDSDLDLEWTTQILHQMADIDLQRLDWRGALGVYEQLRSLAPSDETARRNLVQLNLRLGEENVANAELDNFLEHLQSQSEESAIENFLQWLTSENPEYVIAHRRLAEHFQSKGEGSKAITEWNTVGELLAKKGDREGAKVAVRAILSLSPPNPEPYQKLLQELNS
jgi:tetratricopeptide (TPR) repeat protein